MTDSVLVPLVGVLVVGGLAASVVCWLVLLRRWRLAGPLAPPKAVMGKQEHVARRSLRALLAFDALVVVPVSVPAIAGAVVGRAPELAVLFLAGLLLFVGPVRHLLRNVRALEARRLAGLPEPAPAERRSTGHEPLDRLLGRPAYATRAMSAIIVAVSLAAWFVPGLQELLEKRNAEILAGEYWRLATVALVHAGAIHLFFNVYAFLNVAGLVERLAGWARMLIFFWAGTIAASVASVAVMPAPAVGASGGVFAVLGALLGIALRHRRELPGRVRAGLVRSTVTVIALNVALGFSIPRIDWAAHLGGLVTGIALGLLLGLGREARTVLAVPAAGFRPGSPWRQP